MALRDRLCQLCDLYDRSREGARWKAPLFSFDTNLTQNPPRAGFVVMGLWLHV